MSEMVWHLMGTERSTIVAFARYACAFFDTTFMQELQVRVAVPTNRVTYIVCLDFLVAQHAWRSGAHRLCTYATSCLRKP